MFTMGQTTKNTSNNHPPHIQIQTPAKSDMRTLQPTTPTQRLIDILALIRSPVRGTQSSIRYGSRS